MQARRNWYNSKDIKEIVFVEVKTRTNKKYGEPIDSITYYKKKHLIKSIQFYLYLKKLDNAFIRIDIIEIYKKDDGFLIKHTKGAVLSKWKHC